MATMHTEGPAKIATGEVPNGKGHIAFASAPLQGRRDVFIEIGPYETAADAVAAIEMVWALLGVQTVKDAT